jgi:hypothetical protein
MIKESFFMGAMKRMRGRGEEISYSMNVPRDPERYEQYMDAIQYYDNNLSTLIGAQYFLFAETIRILGTKYHHHRYLAAAQKFELKGCFALTGEKPIHFYEMTMGGSDDEARR